MILSIETATSVCSVALSEKGKLIGLRESSIDKSHASLLTVFIEELFEENKIIAEDLSAVAVSKGPGSYTGLRIGVSTAKGICFGAGLPLIALDTMEGMFCGVKEQAKGLINTGKETLFCPMIDARRMEVYSALFNEEGSRIREVKAEIIDEESYKDKLEKYELLFFGNGADKCKDVIKHKNSIFYEGFELSAAHLIGLAERALKMNDFEDVAYFEPYYLKDFIATIPKKNVLGR